MRILTKLLVLGSAALAAPAMAQESGSASADVTVTLEEAAFVSIEKLRDISYGMVELAGEYGGIGGFGSAPADASLETAFFSRGDSANTYYQYNGQGTPSAGLMQVSCKPGAAFTLSGSAQQGPRPDLALQLHAFVFINEWDEMENGYGPRQLICPASGSMKVAFDSSITITPDTEPGTDINAGSITLEATLG